MRRILVVDSEEADRARVAELFRSMGCSVEEYLEAQSAYSAYTVLHPDIVIADERLGKQSTSAMFQQMRAYATTKNFNPSLVLMTDGDAERQGPWDTSYKKPVTPDIAKQILDRYSGIEKGVTA
jgi:CheY-like chemotaxis protein